MMPSLKLYEKSLKYFRGDILLSVYFDELFLRSRILLVFVRLHSEKNERVIFLHQRIIFLKRSDTNI